ncbi:DUF2141 domain-containing protein [Dyella caseinilytica]|uniref:DUF2141 domain-containing protein n=1 Tax=Dyella caseinilytica TaxID=1849581 RepID=A0ABX7GS73_9GAMM|nr:DUF2141 domain-containing protein [Dyella caseinilytica]QRN52115.1 DUF2141 domain-containing protein [Dyella caseinilytica]GGA15273.1 hypothetical protein GCM10011408_41500 [Dyella caseinilytica]
MAGMLCVSAQASTLVVTVDGVRSTNGTIHIDLNNSEASWKDKAPPFATGTVKAAPGSVTYTFNDVTPGVYSIDVFQDTDGSGKMQTGLFGKPRGGYGFSNNLTLMGKPSFDQANFQVTDKDTTVLVHLKNGV